MIIYFASIEAFKNWKKTKGDIYTVISETLSSSNGHYKVQVEKKRQASKNEDEHL